MEEEEGEEEEGEEEGEKRVLGEMMRSRDDERGGERDEPRVCVCERAEQLRERESDIVESESVRVGE